MLLNRRTLEVMPLILVVGTLCMAGGYLTGIDVAFAHQQQKKLDQQTFLEQQFKYHWRR